jgi:PIN domain nuclease of toxin-antitoxin system
MEPRGTGRHVRWLGLSDVNLLLDTHALIWAVMAPDQLGDRARDAITDAHRRVFASHVSLWEMAIKRRLGKLPDIEVSASEWFADYVPRSHMAQLSIAARHVGAVEFLPPLHRDPFDRLLVAQARVEGLTIVTRDALVTQYEVDSIW